MSHPLIPALPAYPVRGESQVSFANKANDTVAAMPNVVVKQNELGGWMETTATAVDVDAAAAAVSASSASGSYEQVVAISATYTVIHQGSWASAPTTRNGGGALQVGDLYYDTTLGKLQVWS